MLASARPASFPIPFAANAGGSFIRSIPTASQIGITDGAASLHDGFVPDNFTQIAAGGVPPFGQDMNGILNRSTAWNQWFEAGGPIVYDATFQAAIGGYPNGAIVQSAIVPGRQWLSIVDNNMNNPDAYPFTGWTTPPGMNPPGTPIPSFQFTVLPGCVLANGLTIGNTGSGGTTPAAIGSPTTFFLYCAIWLQFSQSICPVQFNGANVTRSANPLADWSAGRVIVLPWMYGAGLIGQDNMGSRASSGLNGVPVQSGSANLPGSIVGENLHSLSSGENGVHNHGINDPTHSHGVNDPGHSHGINDPTHNHPVTGSVFGGNSSGGSAGGAFDTVQQHGGLGTALAATGISIQGAFTGISTQGAATGISTQTSGSGNGHNTVGRNFTVAWNLAL